MIYEQTDFFFFFTEPVKSVRKSHQTIHSRIAMIRLQLFSSRKLTDSNDPFRASLLQWTELTSKEPGDLVSVQLMLQKVTNSCWILGLIIVTENHI